MDVHKLILDGTADDVSELDRFWRRMAPLGYETGTRLRALAAELAKRPELTVSAVAYQEESLELEVILSNDPLREPVRIGRDSTGDHCQVSWERWTEIKARMGHDNERAAMI